jgi:hypothetical protein
VKIKDGRFWFYTAGASLALLVSAPATFAVVSPFHGGTTEFGLVLSVALVLLLEAGAVGAKISGVNWLCVALLVGTVFANYASGNDYFKASALPPTLRSWREAGYGWLMVLVYAASVPVLLYTFLSFAIARYKELGAATEPTHALDVVRVLQREIDALHTAAQLNGLVLPRAPEQIALPEPRAVDDVVRFVCPHCGAALRNQQAHASAVGKGYCPECKTART